MRVIVKAPAKVNLTLNMEGRREDGYHLLSSVFQAVSLSDTVILETSRQQGIHLTLSDPALPCDMRNTAYKAAAYFFEAVNVVPSVSIYVEKIIPQQAGLGGGSADAAGVLVGLNEMYQTNLSTDELCTIGERVGADVPFCIVGGTAMVTGIGEIISPIKPLKTCPMVIAKPPVGVSTAAAYAAVDSVETIPSDQEAICRAIENEDLDAVGKLLGNAFEQALAIPEVGDILDIMRRFSPYGCMMSGSGSAVFALFSDDADMVRCVTALESVADVYTCEPIAYGATVVDCSKG